MIILDTKEKVKEFLEENNIYTKDGIKKRIFECIMLKDLDMPHNVFQSFTDVYEVRDLFIYNCSVTHLEGSTTYLRVIRSIRMVDCTMPRMNYIVNGGANFKYSFVYLENCTGMINIDVAGSIDALSIINMDMYRLSLQMDRDLVRLSLYLFGTTIDQVYCRRGVGMDGYIVPENDSFKFVKSKIGRVTSEREALCFAKSKGGGVTLSSLFSNYVDIINFRGGFIECSLNDISFNNVVVDEGFYVFFSKCDLKGANFRGINRINVDNNRFTSLLLIDCTNMDKMKLPEGCSVKPGTGRCYPYVVEDGRDYHVVEIGEYPSS